MKRYFKMTPEGTRDLLFEECDARHQVEETLTSLFQARGYHQVVTPAVEFFDVFNRDSAGMPPELLYKMTDIHGRLLALRPDSTMPIARIAATRLKDAMLPLRLYYSQNVFRRSPTMTGHSDEMAQSGVELIGASGLRADLEILTMAVDALQSCGAPDFRIEIGHAGFFRALAQELPVSEETREDISSLIESKNYPALSALLDETEDTRSTRAIRLLPRLFGGVEVLDEAARLCRSADAAAALDYLRTVYGRLSELGLGGKVHIDLGLVHRSNYYTGVVFRGYIEGSGITVLSGGRYDGLNGEFGLPRPATGFGVEVDALAQAMLARGDVAPFRVADVLVFGADGCEIRALRHARQLNSQGLVVENSVADTLEEARAYAVRRRIGRVDHVTQTGVERHDLRGGGSV